MILPTSNSFGWKDARRSTNIKLSILYLAALMYCFAPPVRAQSLLQAGRIGGVSEDSGEDVATDADGNIIVAGFFRDSADFDMSEGSEYNLTSEGMDDFFVSKYDANHNFLWAIGGGGTESDFAHGVATDGQGNVLVTGCFQETVDFDPGTGIYNLTSNGGNDIFVLKLTPDGDFLWAFHVGGVGNDGCHDIDVDAAGNVYIGGGFSDTADFDPGPETFEMTSEGELDIYLAKYDPDGQFIWAFSGEGADANQRIWGLTVDDNGNSYVSGWFKNAPDVDPGPDELILTSNGKSDIWLGKYDTNGNLIWAFSMGSSARDHGMKNAIDAEGNVYLSGLFRESIDFDPGPGEHILTTVAPQEAYLARYDSNGNFLWAFNGGHTSSAETSQALAVASDAAGNGIITGFFVGTIDLEPGPGVTELTGDGSNDAYVASYSPDGQLNWAHTLGGSSSDIGHNIATGPSGTVHVTGIFREDIDMSGDPGSPVVLTSSGLSDVFLGTYSGDSNEAPVSEFSYTKNDLSFDFDGSASSDDGSIISWDWDFGDGTTGSGETVSHDYAVDGNFVVTLTVTDDEGASGSSSQEITAGTINAPPVASFDTTVSLLAVDFTDTSTDSDGSIVEWSWDFGDGGTSTDQHPSHVYASNGTYTVTLTVTDDAGDIGEASRDVTVDDGTTEGTMHVASITTVLVREGGSGHVDATILILDDTGNPVEGATVSGTFNGDVSGSDTQVTNASGEAVLASDEFFSRPADVGVCVDNVTHASLVYDPSQNTDPAYACTSSPSIEEEIHVAGRLTLQSETPAAFKLHTNYPNPFNPTTTIGFDLPETSDVRLEVYDMMGRRVATLVNGLLGAGSHEAMWDARSDAGSLVSSGVYLYRLRAGSFVSTRRMILMK